MVQLKGHHKLNKSLNDTNEMTFVKICRYDIATNNTLVSVPVNTASIV